MNNDFLKHIYKGIFEKNFWLLVFIVLAICTFLAAVWLIGIYKAIELK